MRRLVLAVMLMFAAPVAADPLPSAPMTEAPASVYSQPMGRPSGFWTSTRPAVGNRYRWRLLGIGIAFVLGATLLVRRVIRKADAERAGGSAAPALTPPAK